MADPLPPLYATSEPVDWAPADGAPPPWLLPPLDRDEAPRPVFEHGTKLRVAAFCSVGLHFAIVAGVALGLPHINLDWLKLQDAPIKRVDVVFYDPIAAEQVAPGAGAVSQEQHRFGLGEAEKRGLDAGRNPTRLQDDSNRPNGPRRAPGQGRTGEGEAATTSTAKTASTAVGAKADSPEPAEGAESRTAKAAARQDQQASNAAVRPTGADMPETKPGGASSNGQPEGKGKDDKTTTARNRPARETQESAEQPSATPAADNGAPSRRSPLVGSLPILERQDTRQPKQQAGEESQARVIVARLRTDDTRPQPQAASDSTARLHDRSRDQRRNGGPLDIQLAAATPGGEPLLPATGSAANNESGAAGGEAAAQASGIMPIRSAQAMAPAPAEKSSNVAIKLMLQTMPGLDGTLAAAMASPDNVPATPPTPRREQVIARMQKAANQGYAHAQYGVARRELIGQGVPRDPKAAAELLERAAQQGYATAQLALGYMALKGYGVKRDKAEATVWLTLAANQGNEDAARAVALVEPTLTAQELIAVRRLTSEWKTTMGDVTPPAAPEGKAAPEHALLQDAIGRGDISAVRTLIARGEDANGRDREGRTAMINAGWRGDASMVDALMELGADPDIVDNEGRTAIMWAAGNGYPGVVERLIKAGVELDLKDKTGRTAVINAALNGYTDVVKALVAGKANLNLRDDHGKTALDYALRQNYPDIVQVLEKAGAKR